MLIIIYNFKKEELKINDIILLLINFISINKGNKYKNSAEIFIENNFC